MGEHANFLITLLNGDTLLRCALRVHRSDLPGDCEDYPLEPENRQAIHEMLPLHVRSAGPIVDVERIFDVYVRQQVVGSTW